jgi:hypothetical protein
MPQRRAVEKGIQMFGWDACRIRLLIGALKTCDDVRQQVRCVEMPCTVTAS